MSSKKHAQVLDGKRPTISGFLHSFDVFIEAHFFIAAIVYILVFSAISFMVWSLMRDKESAVTESRSWKHLGFMSMYSILASIYFGIAINIKLQPAASATANEMIYRWYQTFLLNKSKSPIAKSIPQGVPMEFTKGDLMQKDWNSTFIQVDQSVITGTRVVRQSLVYMRVFESVRVILHVVFIVYFVLVYPFSCMQAYGDPFDFAVDTVVHVSIGVIPLALIFHIDTVTNTMLAGTSDYADLARQYVD